MSEYITKKKEYITKKKKAEPTGLGQIGRPIKNKSSNILDDKNLQFKLKDSDIVIMVPSTKRVEKRSGGKVCKLATKGKGKAYGKNS